MSSRDWLEATWHASLLLLLARPVLQLLQRSSWVRASVAIVIVVALVYHLEVVHACYTHQALCYWQAP